MPATTIGQQSIEKTVELLRRFQDAPIDLEIRDMSLVITPKTDPGFAITIYDQGDEAMIAAERWHGHWDDPEQVAFCAMWLLTPYYRVAHEFKGGLLAAVWIEGYESDGWVSSDPVYFLNPEHPADWELGEGQIYTRKYVQQAVLPSPWPYDTVQPGAALDEAGLPVDIHIGERSETSVEPVGPTLFHPGDEEEAD
jgi:hypothetical protein